MELAAKQRRSCKSIVLYVLYKSLLAMVLSLFSGNGFIKPLIDIPEEMSVDHINVEIKRLG